MSEENESVGFSCFDTIYLKFNYIGEEEFDDLIEYIEDEHLSYEGATDVFYDLQKENTQLKSVLKEIREYIKENSAFMNDDEWEVFNKKDLLEIIDKGTGEDK